MNSRASRLSRQYTVKLRGYLAQPQEGLLHQAYELGRRAIARGLGVLDVARIHEDAVAAARRSPKPGFKPLDSEISTPDSPKAFLLEVLSPFEAAHRGFQEANDKLRRLNSTLARRNAQLAASENHYKRLFEQARRMEQSLRTLSNQILHVQEEERRRISRELHDDVGQALTYMQLNLALVKKNGSLDKKLFKKIAETEELLAVARETVHRFARELRPAMLDELGLLPALRSCLQAFSERTGLRVRFSGMAEAEQLNPEQKTVLYRVFQESLTNVAKHAKATQVNVIVRPLRHTIEMQIRDDGQGFPADTQLAATRNRRLGLLGIHEWVRLVNGQCVVQSARGKGTIVRVKIPRKAPNRNGQNDAENHRLTG